MTLSEPGPANGAGAPTCPQIRTRTTALSITPAASARATARTFTPGRCAMAELVCRPDQHEAWLDARRQGVTATDVVTLAGLASWDSPFALYWRKKGVLPEVAQSPRMRLGVWLEREIVAYWGQMTDEWHEDGGLYRSSDRAWQLATPDRIIYAEHNQVVGVLEVKTASSREGWGDDGTDQVPARVRAQVLWQMDVMGVATGHVAVCFLPSGEIRSYTITPDPDWIEELRKIAGGFWWGFEADIPPPVDGLPATTEALKHLHANYRKDTWATAISRQLGDEWQMVCDALDVAEMLKAQKANEIRAAMGSSLKASVDGKVVARREVYKRREYVVPAGTVDRLVRVKPKETTDDSS